MPRCRERACRQGQEEKIRWTSWVPTLSRKRRSIHECQRQEILDLTELISHLAANIRSESPNAFRSLNSVNEVSCYLIGKMEIIRNYPDSRVYAELAEILDAPPSSCVLAARTDPENLLAVGLIKVSGDNIISNDNCRGVPSPCSVKRSGLYPGWNHKSSNYHLSPSITWNGLSCGD